MQLLFGFQLLYLFFAMARGFNLITGAGGGVSLLIGGFGGFLVIYLIYRKFPKSVIGLAGLAWAVCGFMLGNFVFGTIGASLIIGFISAVIGGAMNAAFFEEIDKGHAKGEAFAEAILPEIISKKDREGLVVLWHAVRCLDRMKVIDGATFKRLNGTIADILKRPNPPEGSEPMRINDVADGFEAVRMLKDNDMIGVAEAEGIRARIEARENEPRQAPRTEETREPRGRAPMALNADGSLPETERQILVSYLPQLVENRALSSASYARVMAVLEPGIDESELATVAFPYEDSADTDDLETVERLYKAGLIDVAEYRRGLQVILPYLHSANN